MQAAVLEINKSGRTRSGMESKNEGKDIVRFERNQGTVGVRVDGRTELVFQESTWNEDEETMTGLVYLQLRRETCLCSLLEKHTTDVQT